jgi:hypothetical protein
VKDHTYTVASEVHDLLVKTHAADVASNLDIERILAVVTEPPSATQAAAT